MTDCNKTLDLQKASAGSGKTYTLTRQYIEYLITISEEDSPARLRTKEELQDSVPHILAITFTNKATAEMKERIVKSLSELADPAIDPKETYIGYFTKKYGVAAEEVHHLADMALHILLHSYTDFMVSTIDSFSQTILRTFAYEVDLNDSYELELDSKMVATTAVDSLLSDVNVARGGGKAFEWLRQFMLTRQKESNGGSSWNIFAKSKGHKSDYKGFIKRVEAMSSEAFQVQREKLDRYFESHANVMDDFRQLEDLFVGRISSILSEIQKTAKKCETLMANASELDQYLQGRVNKLVNARYPIPKEVKSALESVQKSPWGTFSSKKKKPLTADENKLQSLVGQLYELKEEAREYLAGPEWKLWNNYRQSLRILPLMYYAAKRSQEILRENNVVQLADTNLLLRRIIGKDDAPFIYERLGTKLNHFLIDEFQDTSSLQWENLRPLMDESMSRGCGNLIIGDAKQSIYRFRNADSSLITTQIPADYNGFVNHRGSSVEENTNHRSFRDIVRLNNTLFTRCAARYDQLYVDATDDTDRVCHKPTFAELYANVAQFPKKTGHQGYVEFIYHTDEKVDGEDNEKVPAHYDDMVERIAELHARGYLWKDIAVFVRRKDEGKALIKRILEYNRQQEDASKRIEFVSEESLLVGNSAAVQTVVSALRLMTEGFGEPLKKQKGEKGDKPASDTESKLSLALFNCRYERFALRFEGTPEECMNRFLESNEEKSPLQELLPKVQSLALPALTEAIVSEFVTETQRREEAPFIAAFQDLVLKYCERYPADVASFLQWWDRTKDNAGISSPAGMDAVNIMTIHKAKGLDFRCVIIPDLNDKYIPYYPPTAWLPPSAADLNLPAGMEELLPPILPVEIKADLKGTSHEDVFRREYRDNLMDILNLVYVAMTRAVCEMYIFMADKKKEKKDDKKGKKKKKEAPAEQKEATVADTMRILLDEMAKASADDKVYFLDGAEMKVVEAEEAEDEGAEEKHVVGYQIGKPFDRSEIDALHRKDEEKEKDSPKKIDLTEYPVNLPGERFHFRERSQLFLKEDDQRTEGIDMHSILSEVRVATDLPAALRNSRIQGVITVEREEELRKFLGEKLAWARVAKWFAPGLRIINERDVLFYGSKNQRPDRVVVDAEGNATVVDYKFGKVHEPKDKVYKQYLTQVRDYVDILRRTGKFRSVTGYVWYVRHDTIVPVTD